jgi:hypothetical protein
VKANRDGNQPPNRDSRPVQGNQRRHQFRPELAFLRGGRQILVVQHLKSGFQEWAPSGGAIDTAAPKDGPAACVAGVSTSQWEHSQPVCSVKHELQFSMLARLFTYSLFGIDAKPVEVEVDIGSRRGFTAVHVKIE